MMVARPRNMINMPNALVNISRPRTSTRTMEVRVIRAAMETPNIRLMMMNSVKLSRRGKMRMEIPRKIVVNECLQLSNGF